MTWIWKGGPEVSCVPGIPARDLTDEEAKQYPEVKDSPYYEHVRARPSRAPRKATGGEEGSAD